MGLMSRAGATIRLDTGFLTKFLKKDAKLRAKKHTLIWDLFVLSQPSAMWLDARTTFKIGM